MPRKGENIYKRKDGRWEGRFIKCRSGEKGTVYGYVYAKTYSDVKEKLISAKASLCQENGINAAKDISFEAAAGFWLSNKSNMAKASTVNRYKNLLNNHVLPFIGSNRISKISTLMLQNYIQFLSISGRIDKRGGLSGKTISDIVCVIKSVLHYSESLGCRFYCCLRYIGYKTEKKEMRVLSKSEQKTLTDFLTSDITRTKAGILLSLYTGIRIGELCALKAGDFDFLNKKLCVKQTLQRLQNNDSGLNKTYIAITEPKSASSVREIPLPEFICNIYSEMKSDGNVFILSGTAEPVEPRTMENRYNRIMKSLNIENSTFHTLRHTFATRSIEVGFDVKSLSEILGHSSVNITLNRYVHSSFELKKENMKKMEALVCCAFS